MPINEDILQLIQSSQETTTYNFNPVEGSNDYIRLSLFTQNDEFVERLSNLIPLGRMAKREEYRGVIQFMCSDAAMYLNGQNIIMDGGRSVL